MTHLAEHDVDTVFAAQFPNNLDIFLVLHHLQNSTGAPHDLRSNLLNDLFESFLLERHVVPGACLFFRTDGATSAMTVTKFSSLYSTCTNSLALSLDVLTAFARFATCRLKVYLKRTESVRTIILGMPSKPFLAKGILLSETSNGITYLPTFTTCSIRARVGWKEDDVATLHRLCLLHEDFPDVEVVRIFQSKHPHTLHTTQAVKYKLSHLKNEKGLVTGAQIRRTHARLSKPIKRYNKSIKDKPITPCEKCGRLLFRCTPANTSAYASSCGIHFKEAKMLWGCVRL
ncbi:hypothetical protein GOP47_0024924 [Adiantum capillus-veneris]|uniref:Uncharacterized protein n=1 Tax=Adiantum capillus-veneris TaxID=13818 RepID=A0A9D4Z431_ADICA|nr:hypothetical protein GOP47_0024924 [Adiantum capillus-veneris]